MSSIKPVIKIGMVGAGKIADTHAEIIANHPALTLTAIADNNVAKARTFAERWGENIQAYDSAKALAEGSQIDAVHIVSPPDSHATLATFFTERKLPVFIEKPAAVTAAELESLSDIIEYTDAHLSVNRNSLYYPAFEKMCRILEKGALGPLRSVQAQYSKPLARHATTDLHQWAYRKPVNTLLERAVHPLAQIQWLTGPLIAVNTINTSPLETSNNNHLFQTTMFNLKSETIGAQLLFNIGETYPFWEIHAVCSDGVIKADMISNRTVVSNRNKWLAASEQFLGGRSLSKQLYDQSVKNFLSYATSFVSRRERSDPFYLSMKKSISVFYEELERAECQKANFKFAATIAHACLTAEQTMQGHKVNSDYTRKGEATEVDLAVLGGTGFIGRYIVEQCLKQGMTIRVVARDTHNLPSVFRHANIDIVSGDLCDPNVAKKAVKGAKKIINLVHGGGGQSASAILKTMRGSADIIYKAATAAGVERFIHMGSIAGLYLGNRNEVITGNTPPDQKPHKRGDYARAKALTDIHLLALAAEGGPALTILRPAVVAGRGTTATHSGLGIFNNEQHCMGWNKGTSNVPFVLASDVAGAAVACLTADNISNKCFNLVGDVPITARAYIEALKASTGRPFTFHPQSPIKVLTIENIKVLIKRVGGKKQPFHSLRDFKSRAKYAAFDCTDAKEALDWHPVSDKETFLKQAVHIYAAPRQVKHP
ncbi:MAG: Gfo/Idh/MocA family oxidoreductase [Kordiimonadaceae bacterium]|nr:Gfo/Idh/MocA family oxidoreductase [Kordiimonadaceae bacterium]